VPLVKRDLKTETVPIIGETRRDIFINDKHPRDDIKQHAPPQTLNIKLKTTGVALHACLAKVPLICFCIFGQRLARIINS